MLEKSEENTHSLKQNEILDELKYSYSRVTNNLFELDEKIEDIKYRLRQIQEEFP